MFPTNEMDYNFFKKAIVLVWSTWSGKLSLSQVFFSSESFQFDNAVVASMIILTTMEIQHTEASFSMIGRYLIESRNQTFYSKFEAPASA